MSGIHAEIYDPEKVYFMSDIPVIDGRKNKYVQGKMREFSDVHKTSESFKAAGASYFLGYNSHYFYIFIETAGDSITIRDRGYQNGDGFHLTIGRAYDDLRETDEFYVLGFSPKQDWSNKMRWYYNVDLSMKRLGDEVIFKSSAIDGRTYFELLIPWNTVHPYHPWINNDIGFNLCFVKAEGENEKIYYFLKTDERMQSEQSKRKYVRLVFEDPALSSMLYAVPSSNNIEEGQHLDVLFTGHFQENEKRAVTVRLYDESDDRILNQQFNIGFEKGLSKKTERTESSPEKGTYQLKIYENDEEIAVHSVSVRQKIDIDRIKNILSDNREFMKEGSYNTLLFYLNDLKKNIHDLKSYEYSSELNSNIAEFLDQINQVETGKDPLSKKSGVYRRGFISEIDNELRPYSIYIPETYNQNTEHPLIVYLHGSGEDDRTLLRSDFIKEGFVILAPNGRGTSNCFATEESQTDIREAVEDVIKNYNIDRNRVILSGFSMGGYGVYRTYYETPDLFSALAVFSGRPDLGKKWGIEDAPDFLDTAYADLFSNIPMFIYHGEKDLNCPYELTKKFVDMISSKNRNIIFITDENAGHGNMNENVRQNYQEWLKGR